MKKIKVELDKNELKTLLFWRARCEDLSERCSCYLDFLMGKRICVELNKKLWDALKKVDPNIKKIIVKGEKIEKKTEYIG